MQVSAFRLKALLQQAHQAWLSGQLKLAQEVCAQALVLQREQPDALLIWAETLLAQGDVVGAEVLLDRAVTAHPAHAQAWFRLGDAREKLGRIQQAEQAQRRAVEAMPRHPLAHYHRARLLRLLGLRDAAAESLAQALALPPPTPKLQAQMMQLKALLQEESGELGDALLTLDQALRVAPDRAVLHHNRGVLLQRLARPVEALEAVDRALALGLQGAEAHYNRGNSLQSMGRSEDALQAYRSALARDGQFALALFDIARLRWRLGDAEFLAELEAAEAAAPTSSVAPGIKGRLLLRAERYAEAAAAFEKAAMLDPTAAGYFDGWGQALGRQGRFEEALLAHARAVELTPEHPGALVGLATALLQVGRAAEAANVAHKATRLDPCDQHAWAVLDLVWRELRDPRAGWLNDYSLLVQVYEIEAPPGWDGIDQFNAALAQELTALHGDTQAPIDQTLRHGSQTLGNIFELDHPLVHQLKAAVSSAIDRYVEHLAALALDPDHPLLGRNSRRWRFSDSWSSRLRRGGFHSNHVHPHGWISSCYYVSLPPSMAQASGADRSGWIQFGVPDLGMATCTAPCTPTPFDLPPAALCFSLPTYGTAPCLSTKTRIA